MIGVSLLFSRRPRALASLSRASRSRSVWPAAYVGVGLLTLLPLAFNVPVSAQETAAATAQNGQAGRTITDPVPPADLPDSGPSAPIAGVAYSPDGKVLYSLDASGELRSRDVQNGKNVFLGRVSAPAEANPKGVSGPLKVLSDGSLCVGRGDGTVTHYAPPAPDKPLQVLHDFSGGRGVLPADAAIFSAVTNDILPSPDESYLAVSTIVVTRSARPTRGRTGTPRAMVVQVWNLKSGEAVCALPALTVPPGFSVPRVAWTKDGEALVVALTDGKLQAYDAQTATPQGGWSPPGPAVNEANGNAAPARRPGGTGATGDTLQGLSPEGTRVLTLSRGGLLLWNTRDNTSRLLEDSARFRGSSGRAEFSADGDLIAFYHGVGFDLWKADGSHLGSALIPFESYTSLAFAPGGKFVSLGDSAGMTREWEVTSPLAQTANTTFSGYFNPWRALQSRATTLFAQTNGGTATLNATGALQWLPSEPIAAPAAIPEAMRNQVRAVVDALAVAPDGQSWVESVHYTPYPASFQGMGIPGGELRARDAQTGAVLWRKTNTSAFSQPTSLAFLPDGTLLTGQPGGGRGAGPGADFLIGLHAFDGRTGEEKPSGISWEETKRGFTQPGSVSNLLVSTEGKTLIVANDGGNTGVQIVNLTTHKVEGFFGANTDLPPGPWALSPDGQWLAVNLYNGIVLWNLTKRPDNDVKATPLPLDENIGAFCFGSDGSFYVGLADGTVQKWDKDLSNPTAPQWQTQPGRAITTLTVSADGKTLWSGNERGDLTARDAQTGTFVSTLRLMPPTAEDGTPTWVIWQRDGKLQTVAP